MAKNLAELDREFASRQVQTLSLTQGTRRAESGAKLEPVSESESDLRPKPVPTETPKDSAEKRQWRMFCLQTGCVCLTVYLLLTVVFGITVVHGQSMQPSLYDGDVALLWRLSRDYEPGSMVLFQGENRLLVKRVIAGPGDLVEIDNETGQVIVNNVILHEEYIYAETYSKSGETEFPLHLAAGEYFLLGDNRTYALDSRSASVGAVHQREIKGRILLLLRRGG